MEQDYHQCNTEGRTTQMMHSKISTASYLQNLLASILEQHFSAAFNSATPEGYLHQDTCSQRGSILGFETREMFPKMHYLIADYLYFTLFLFRNTLTYF